MPDAAPLGALPRGSDRGVILAEVHARLEHLPPHVDVLIACSGGPDSTALALLVAAARPDVRCTLVYVAHGLRTTQQDVEEAGLVAALAVRLGVDHVVRTVRVSRSGSGLESAARDARHAALEALADERGATVILYGHHADDQAETLLLRLARGSGLDGLGGMAHVAGRRVRPLLRVRRDDLRRVLDGAEGLQTALDPMNEDVDLRRVRVRHDVLPALDAVGPDVVGALTRFADLARDDAALLDRLAVDAVTGLGRAVFGQVIVVDTDALVALHVALLRRVLRRLLAEVGGAGPDAASVERLARAVGGSPAHWRATLPGPVDAEVERGVLVLAPSVQEAGPRSSSLRVPGQVVWEAAGFTLRARTRSEAQPTPTASRPASTQVLDASVGLAGLDASRLRVTLTTTGPFVVRARRDGDRLRTHGGTRTLADVMGEAGVLRALRHRLPVLADAETDRPLWVPGLIVDVGVLAGGPADAACTLEAVHSSPTH